MHPAKTAVRLVLLFSHGVSYDKHCWKPILRYLRESPFMKRVEWEAFAYDLRFHGENRDESVTPRVYFLDGVKSSPRVEHPLRHWPEWGPADVLDIVAKLRNGDELKQRRTQVIGIGHSMGATSLIKAEVTRPGTLDGVVAFDPVFNDGAVKEEEFHALVDMLVSITLAREYEWDSWADVVEHVTTARYFRGWAPEARQAFLDHCIVPTDNGARFRRVLAPIVEAASYSHDLTLLDEPVLAKAKCKIALEYASRTPFFHPGPMGRIAESLAQTVILSDPIPNTTHSLIFEEPKLCAERIVTALEKFPAVKSALATAML